MFYKKLFPTKIVGDEIIFKKYSYLYFDRVNGLRINGGEKSDILNWMMGKWGSTAAICGCKGHCTNADVYYYGED